MNPEFNVETPEGNYEQRCLCVLCLDTSSSMGFDTPKPIDDLNESLVQFAELIKEDPIAKNRLEISIVTFDSEITTIQEPALVEKFEMPKLSEKGTTKLVDGVRESIIKIEERKQWYRENGIPYFRPFIVLMTDGAPDPDQDISGLSEEIRKGVENKKFTFWAVGTKKYDHSVLQKICYGASPKTIAENAENHVKYREFFKWLSNSLKTVSKSRHGEEVVFGPTDGWGGGTFSQTNID